MTPQKLHRPRAVFLDANIVASGAPAPAFLAKKLLAAAAMALGALLASSPAANADTSGPYFDVSIGYAATNWEDVEAGFGAAVSFGTVIKERHIIEGTVMYLKHDIKNVANADLTQMPVLASYRYAIPLGADSGWRLEAGCGAGAALEKAKIKRYGKTYSEDKWVAAISPQAKAVYAINKTVSVSADLRATWTEAAFEDGDDGFTTFVSAGLSFRF
jgi:hypothetical protein